ncbi:PREDICTED: nucleoporin GLE1-like [Priapulus caudatus]|uniref:mRNA export factor GLE1 n=1 Tax=Priapulus caudatus TaxID=37621 RepID=A0ABM1ED73_PRICU|nr:PREDICTED: nucleoporin GLE1-like [Priapulus caudatus]
MPAESPVLEALAKTEKGQLKYDKNWLGSGNWKKVLDECVSPPTLSPRVIPPSIQKPGSPIPYDDSYTPSNKKSRLSSDGEISCNDGYRAQVSPFEIAIVKSEKQWLTRTKEVVARRKKNHDLYWREVQEKAQHQLTSLEAAQERNTDDIVQSLMTQEEDNARQMWEKRQRLQEASSHRQQRLDMKLKEAQQMQEDAEMQRKLEEESTQHMTSLLTLQQQLHQQHEAIQACVAACRHRSLIGSDKLRQIMDAQVQAADKLKKLRFDLTRAVNTPVNSISPASGGHLQDKLHRIARLLDGQTVEVAGRRVSARDHAQGLVYVHNLFARKIVRQGDEQVASNHESAFAIAAVAVEIWCKFPSVGDLILAHFQRKCPYLVPYYVPREEGQTDEQYYRRLGYNYSDDGAVEKQDKFLARMSGLVRLYAAMLTTRPLAAGAAHPHGARHGWAWLSRTLNLEPRPDVTATLIYDFLQVSGHTLMKLYGRQFQKLLCHLCQDYLPRIERVTAGGQGGPLARLRLFLETCVKSGAIPPPPGQLPYNFWNT